MVGCRQRLLPPELNVIEIACQDPNKLLLTGHVNETGTHTTVGRDALCRGYRGVPHMRGAGDGRRTALVFRQRRSRARHRWWAAPTDRRHGFRYRPRSVCCSVLMWRSLKSRRTPRTPLIFARSALRDIALNLFTTLDILLQERSATRVAPRRRRSTSAMSRTLSRLREALGDPVLVPAQARRQPAGPRSGKTARPGVALRNWAHRCRNAI